MSPWAQARSSTSALRRRGGWRWPLAAGRWHGGATAAIEAVMTDPAHQRAGLARALVRNAVARARAVGCDVVFLVAAADDWPRGWYVRLGFIDVGTRFEATLAN